jgi:hypothetical protein
MEKKKITIFGHINSIISVVSSSYLAAVDNMSWPFFFLLGFVFFLLTIAIDNKDEE